METFDPTGSDRTDRHCDHRQAANKGCRNGSDSLVREIGLADVGLVGGKGANLGELTAAGLPVPGFVVTAEAYLHAVSESGARARLTQLLNGLNADDDSSLTVTQEAARESIMGHANPSRDRRGH